MQRLITPAVLVSVIVSAIVISIPTATPPVRTTALISSIPASIASPVVAPLPLPVSCTSSVAASLLRPSTVSVRYPAAGGVSVALAVSVTALTIIVVTSAVYGLRAAWSLPVPAIVPARDVSSVAVSAVSVVSATSSAVTSMTVVASVTVPPVAVAWAIRVSVVAICGTCVVSAVVVHTASAAAGRCFATIAVGWDHRLRNQVLVLLIHSRQRGLLFGSAVCAAAGLLFFLHAATEIVKAFLIDFDCAGRYAFLALVETLAGAVSVLCFSLHEHVMTYV